MSKMKIGKDGSFARITSSMKGIVPRMKIAEVPEEEKKESGLSYKLVWTGPVEKKDELSDTSDDELWSDEEDISTVLMPVENTEKSEDIHSNEKGEVVHEPSNCTPDKQFVSLSANKKSDNHHSDERNDNPSNILHNKSIASASNMEKSNFRHKSINRNSFGASKRNYNQSIKKADNISPWITSQEAFMAQFQHVNNQCGMANHQYGMPNHQYDMPNRRYDIPNHRYDMPNHRYDIPNIHPVEDVVHTIPNSSIGLLGPMPYSPPAANYLQNSQSDNSRFDASCWNSVEYHQSDNYQGTGRDQAHFQKGRYWHKNRKAHFWGSNRSNQAKNHPLQRRYQERDYPLPARRPDTNPVPARRPDRNSSRIRRQNTNSSNMRRQNPKNEP